MGYLRSFNSLNTSYSAMEMSMTRSGKGTQLKSVFELRLNTEWKYLLHKDALSLSNVALEGMPYLYLMWL